MPISNLRTLLAAAAAISLVACGGGGGGDLASIPPPPAPPRAASVDIFPSPASQEFAALGNGDSLRIRYDAASGLYEVMPGDQGWKTLVDDPTSSPFAGSPNVSFVFAEGGASGSYFVLNAHYSYTDPNYKYQYSNLANWGRQNGSIQLVGQHVAFGMATPTAAIPVTGAATYNGMIVGTSSEKLDNSGEAIASGYIKGSINLAFNFGAGTLSGSISPEVYLSGQRAIATLTFTNTIYSAGSPGFSGRFNTNLAGQNAFSGLFTGPNANELIGKFAFPYTSPFDGTSAQAAGAFIAKK